jgi:pilus assembly protein Flp/PilA
MRNTLLKLSAKAQLMRDTLKDESGQDLIEYAFVITLIASAATAGLITVASDINTIFSTIGSKLTTG